MIQTECWNYKICRNGFVPRPWEVCFMMAACIRVPHPPLLWAVVSMTQLSIPGNFSASPPVESTWTCHESSLQTSPSREGWRGVGRLAHSAGCLASMSGLCSSLFFSFLLTWEEWKGLWSQQCELLDCLEFCVCCALGLLPSGRSMRVAIFSRVHFPLVATNVPNSASWKHDHAVHTRRTWTRNPSRSLGV